jgi:hypothetical protein
MPNPKAIVSDDKRPLLLGATVAAVMLIVMFLFSSLSDDDEAGDTSSASDARLVSNRPQSADSAGISAITAEPDERQRSEFDITGSPPMPATESAGIPATETRRTSDELAAIAGADTQTPEPDVPAPAPNDEPVTAATPEVASYTLEEYDKVVRELRQRLQQKEAQLQALQSELNDKIQLAGKKQNEADLWRREAAQLEATKQQIIEDNIEDSEMLSREVERWRQRALEAERQIARLAAQRSSAASAPPPALKPLPARSTAQSQAAPPQTQSNITILPQQQPPPMPQAPPLQSPPAAQGPFNTTCYDPGRGYFPCRVQP